MEIRRVSQPGASILITTSNYFSALQGINFIRRNTCGYPYGYQRNWKEKALKARLADFFAVRSVEYMHADRDMPFVRAFDQVVARVHSQWARYMHIVCENEVRAAT